MILARPLPAVCAFCGCLCEDVQVEAGEGGLVKPMPECARARSKTSELSRAPDLPQIDGQTATWAHAYAEAQRLLAAAHSPLLLLGGAVPLRAVKPALDLAHRIGAAVDTPFSASGAASVRAAAEIGTVSPSLGELRDQAEAILVLGADPGRTHPRFAERFLGKEHHRIIIDLNSTFPKEMVASLEWRLPPGEPILPALVSLRLALAERADGMDAQLRAVTEAVKAARYGAVLFGSDVVNEGSATVSELVNWVQALNDHFGRWTLLPLLEQDLTGLHEALLVQAGFPCAFHYGKDGAEFSPGAWSAEGLLRHGEVDLGIEIGQAGWLSVAAASRWNDLPRLSIGALPPSDPRGVWFPAATPGFDCGGEALRMDGVPFRLDPWVDSRRVPAEEILAVLSEGRSV